MRYIVVFLVLINVAYLGWHTFNREPARPAVTAAPRPLLNRGLVLLDEYTEQTVAQLPQALAPEPVVPTAARVCYLVGDFASIDDARSFLRLAELGGLSAELHLTGAPLETHYRVLLPPAENREAATETLAALGEEISAQNLQIETYLITRGLLENAIALGVFSNVDNAVRVQDIAAGLGYTAEINEIPRSDGAVQVVVAAPDFTPVGEAQWLDFAGDGLGLTRSENLCETIAPKPQFP